MAQSAQLEIQNRKVTVNRHNLIEKLKENRLKHIKEYQEAAAAYKAAARELLDNEYEKIKIKIAESYGNIHSGINNFDANNPSATPDHWTITNSASVTLKVPRNFVDLYDSAIAIAQWDVCDTMELSYAEFQCFVRDEWDWKPEFEAVSAIYKAKFL